MNENYTLCKTILTTGTEDHLFLEGEKVFVKNIEEKNPVLGFSIELQVVSTNGTHYDWNDELKVCFCQEDRVITSTAFRIDNSPGIYPKIVKMLRDDEVKDGVEVRVYSEANIFHEVSVKINLKKNYPEHSVELSANY